MVGGPIWLGKMKMKLVKQILFSDTSQYYQETKKKQSPIKINLLRVWGFIEPGRNHQECFRATKQRFAPPNGG